VIRPHGGRRSAGLVRHRRRLDTPGRGGPRRGARRREAARHGVWGAVNAVTVDAAPASASLPPVPAVRRCLRDAAAAGWSATPQRTILQPGSALCRSATPASVTFVPLSQSVSSCLSPWSSLSPPSVTPVPL